MKPGPTQAQEPILEAASDVGVRPQPITRPRPVPQPANVERWQPATQRGSQAPRLRLPTTPPKTRVVLFGWVGAGRSRRTIQLLNAAVCIRIHMADNLLCNPLTEKQRHQFCEFQ
jgi:hypothetical protein